MCCSSLDLLLKRALAFSVRGRPDLAAACRRRVWHVRRARFLTSSAALSTSARAQWEEWDVRRSLFDNRLSGSMEENLEYMFKNFGFYFPDAQYLKDPEGLLQYLVGVVGGGTTPAVVQVDKPGLQQTVQLSRMFWVCGPRR